MPTMSDRVISSASQARDLGGGLNWTYGQSRAYRTTIPFGFARRSPATKTTITAAEVPIDASSTEEAQKIAIGAAKLMQQTQKAQRPHLEQGIGGCWGAWLVRDNALAGQSNPLNQFREGIVDSELKQVHAAAAPGTIGGQTGTFSLRLIVASNKTTNTIYETNIATHTPIVHNNQGQQMWYQTSTTLTIIIPAWTNELANLPIQVSATTSPKTFDINRIYYMLLPVNIGLNF